MNIVPLFGTTLWLKKCVRYGGVCGTQRAATFAASSNEREKQSAGGLRADLSAMLDELALSVTVDEVLATTTAEIVVAEKVKGVAI